MNKIKFSHRYYKMPEIKTYNTQLLEVLLAESKDLSKGFIDYDTSYDGGSYTLSKGKVLILMLWTGGKLWTTVRRWTPQKEKYYRGLIGQDVEIVVEEKNE